MAEVGWSREALAKLDLIAEYIRQFDPRAAQRIAERLFAAGQSLSDFPNRGRPLGGKLREIVTVQPYILQYRVDGDRVLILGIRHAAQLSEAD